MARRSSAGSQADMTQIPDWAPYDSLAFNKQFNMKEYEAYAALQKSSTAPFTLSGRRWWAAGGHILSGIAILVAIAAEALFVLRDASAIITTLPVTATHNDEEGDELSMTYEGASSTNSAIDTKRLVRRLLIRAAKNATKAAKAQTNVTKENSTPPSLRSNYTCQWANNTDVLNTGTGTPLAVSYHTFTAVVLAVLLLAQCQLWRHVLHASAMLNIGIVQLWAGLAMLSRSMDIFSIVAGYALLMIGLGNIVFGVIARFLPGGPGMSLFGTGKTPAEVAQAEEAWQNAASLQAQAAEAAVAKENELSEKAKQEEAAALSAKTSMPGFQHQMLAAPPIDPTLAAASGYETSPMMSQLAALSNNTLYQTIMGRAPKADEEEYPSQAPPAHLLLSPYDSKTRSKLWKQRMPEV